MVDDPAWLVDSRACIDPIEPRIKMARLAEERRLAAMRLRARLTTRHIVPDLASLPGIF